MGKHATLAFVLLLLAVCSVKGGSNGSCVKLLLPEAGLVNKFLISNCSNCTNPLFKDEESRPLQVIKCQPKLVNEKGFGPAYDIYQVEAPGSACDSPPPVKTTVHHHDVGRIKYWLLFAVFYLTLFWILDSLVAFRVPLEINYALRSRVETKPVDLEAPELQLASECEGRRETAKVQPRAKYSSRLASVPALQHADALVGAYYWTTVYLAFFLAAHMTFAQIEEVLPEKTTELMGPVDLPDPSQGLNLFLQEVDADLSLELCKTSKMSFSVGFPDSCKGLGDPYGKLEAPVKIGAPSQAKSFIFAWIEAAGRSCLYLSGFWFIIFSIAGNVVLVLLLLGACKFEKLKDVSSSVHTILLAIREYYEADRQDRWAQKVSKK